METKLRDLYPVSDYTNPIGIELEVEFLEAAPIIETKNWRSKREGSLRYYGAEFVNPSPICLSKKRTLIEGLLKTIRKVPLIEDSPRTSIHVHVNVLDYTPVQVWTAACAYWILENLLFKYCGKEREGNLFCLRLCDAQGVIDYILHDLTLSSKTDRPFTSFRGDAVRYAGLNINAVPKFGSLEFRGMRGAVDATIMDTWSTEMYNIINNAATKYKDPEDLMDTFFKSDKKDFMKTLLSSDFVDLLISLDKTWKDLVDSNTGIVMGIAYFHDWSTWGNTVDKIRQKRTDRTSTKASVLAAELAMVQRVNRAIRAVENPPVQQVIPDEWMQLDNGDF